jgi:two-component system chemotaxis response regulator CheB
MIRLLICDDSLFIRTTLEKILSNDDIEVVGKARNGKEGVELCKELKPDVMTMDIEMPIMTGIEAVEEIMKTTPTPILMVSTLTKEGAEETMKALSLGAMDFITKSHAFKELYGMKEELLTKIKAIVGKRPRRRFLTKNRTSGIVHRHEKEEKTEENYEKYLTGFERPKASDIEVIGIGISTGGPAALQEFLPKLNPNLPVSIIVAQHMPPYFTASLAVRLNGISKLKVKESEDGEFAKPGVVYIAPGGKLTTLSRRGTIVVSDEPADSLYKPSVDVLFESLIRSHMNKVVGLIMTGMGNDGTKEMKKLKEIGGYVIAQDIESSVIFGMPKSAILSGAVSEIQPLHNLAESVNTLFGMD